jgi:hypothetical protein
MAYLLVLLWHSLGGAEKTKEIVLKCLWVEIWTWDVLDMKPEYYPYTTMLGGVSC